MPLIKIITAGTYGHRQGNLVVRKTLEDDPFEVTQEEAERAVSRKIAKIVIESTSTKIAEELNNNDVENKHIPPGREENIIYTTEELGSLKQPRLREIAKEMELDIQLHGVSNESIIESILDAQNSELLGGDEDGIVE